MFLDGSLRRWPGVALLSCVRAWSGVWIWTLIISLTRMSISNPPTEILPPESDIRALGQAFVMIIVSEVGDKTFLIVSTVLFYAFIFTKEIRQTYGILS
jgi:putative Ca2+/H+ antiporter (TMEM165/GDT1 family)